ncbi:hypothetical protein EXW43_16345 [Bacillus mycoides]|nr:hypothetical protein COJ43_22915 [Bacillus cereus]QWI38627.1 hypothetical protein EXW43_16345 [Bacillus mycoides]
MAIPCRTSEDKKYCSSCAKRFSSFEIIGFIKNAILSVYFYKKNSVFFALWIQIYLSLIAMGGTPLRFKKKSS